MGPDAVEKLGSHPGICIVRIKDRLSTLEKATTCGWADVLMNFYFADDPYHHIVEIQLFHDLLMQTRQGLGGHKEIHPDNLRGGPVEAR